MDVGNFPPATEGEACWSGLHCTRQGNVLLASWHERAAVAGRVAPHLVPSPDPLKAFKACLLEALARGTGRAIAVS
jgi:hypothetical protein